MVREWREGESCLECGTTVVLHHAHGLCKNCYRKQWRKNNPEKERAIYDRYRSSDKWKETERKYNESDVGSQAQSRSSKRYRGKNRELCLERTKEWRDKNRDHIKRYNDSQRIKKWRNKYGEEALKKLLEVNYSCEKCGSDHRLAVHHIDWDRTNNIYDNFAILCNGCHSKLHLWTPPRLRRSIFVEWMETQ